MVNRKDVSVIHNRWHDSQRVDKSDMDVEQDRNINTDAAIIQNHFGSGVLLESAQQLTLFDSDDLTAEQASIEAAGNFDGTGLDAHAQPSDINLGNQIEVTLTGSSAFGRFSTKVAIIGLSFDDQLQIDRFYFYKDEKQVTSKHYKRILSIFFNDFKGNNNCSRNLGGRIVIKQAASFQLSRDPEMVSQDVEPDIFWRDFKVADAALSLFTTIQNGIGSEYDADNLNINVTGRPDRELPADDVTTQVGQKFLATTDNIQKITLLLGVRRDDEATEENKFDWTGDIIVSIYPLQTSTTCPTDIIPELAIDFDPSNEPLAQLSYSQTTLEDIGYVLTDILQPVDFVFNATKLGYPSTSKITPGKFYVVTVKRSGASTSGTLFLGVGNDRIDDSRLTTFSGVWADVSEEDLWFQVWTDAFKIADGKGYDEGNGIQFDKTTIDESTGATIDNQIRFKSLADTGEGVLNIGVIQAIETESITVQDERTGNNVNSRKKFEPSFSFVDEAGLADLKEVSSPLIIGCAKDINPKQNPELEKIQTYVGLAKGDQFCVINPDPDLLSLNLIGSKLVPNADCPEISFRIFKSELCTDGYADVNGDGYVDSSDISAASELIGESLFYTTTQQKIVDGYFTTLEVIKADVDGDGYVTSDDVDLITQYVNLEINAFPVGSTFSRLCLTLQNSTGRIDGYHDCSLAGDDGYVRTDGYSGLNIVDSDLLSATDLKYFGFPSTPSLEADAAFTTVPFVDVTYQVKPIPFWQPWFVVESSGAKVVPSIFPVDDVPSLVNSSYDCSDDTSAFTCTDSRDEVPVCNPGRNDAFFPGNILYSGELLRPDGNHAKIDFEVGTVILQLPAIPLEEVTIDMFKKFVSSRGDSLTRAGYPAMKYSDCTLVQDSDLSLNRVRFSVSIEAFYPSLDGYSDGSDGSPDGYAIIIDNIIGVFVDSANGLLKLSIKDLAVDEVFKTLVTKIQINVFLKKAGFNNGILVIEPSQVEGLLS